MLNKPAREAVVIRNKGERMKKIIGFLFVSALILVSCSKKQETLEVGTHPADWNNPQSEQFHGLVVTQTGPASCQSCHGEEYEGGTSDISCYTCHAGFPHPEGFLQPGSPNYHATYIKNVINYNIISCKNCHGSSYAGGSSGVSCKTSGCHTQSAGPQACNTCHGNLNNPAQIAPPRDLDGKTSHTAPGVGAHQAHVTEPEVTNSYRCSACHPQLTGFSDPAHINTTPGAQMQFNALATDNGRLSVNWDRNNLTCSSVYCHGWFEYKKGDAPANLQFAFAADAMVGNQTPVVWTAENDDCNFCHGLPPTGHISSSLNGCSSCHANVISSDGKIINKSLHINGQADVSIGG
jgi:hypothetical protein